MFYNNLKFFLFFILSTDLKQDDDDTKPEVKFLLC